MRGWLATLLAGCHVAAPAVAPAWSPPHAERFVTSTGVDVIVVENHRLPLVAIAVIAGSAGSRDDGDAHGLAALTADLVIDGLDPDGARLEAAISTDAATFELQVRAEGLAPVLGVLAGAIAHPAFADAAIERMRTARLARVADHGTRARTAAAQRFDQLVFGRHPYAHPAEGESASLAAITAAQVRTFHASHYGHLAIVVAGDTDRAHVEPLVTERFASTSPATHVAPLPPPTGPILEQLAVPGGVATIVAGGRGQAGDAPDRIAAELANAAMGGAPDARLDRAFTGLSLAASSSFWRGAGGGSWAIATTVEVAQADRAIAIIRAQLRLARERGFTDAELAAARTQLLRGLPRSFATDLGTARAFAKLVVLGLPTDYYATYARHLAAVTAGDAHRAIAPLWTDPIIVVARPAP